MDRLFAGSEGAAAAAAAAAASGGGGSQGGAAPKVMSFRGWTLDMLQVSDNTVLVDLLLNWMRADIKPN